MGLKHLLLVSIFRQHREKFVALVGFAVVVVEWPKVLLCENSVFCGFEDRKGKYSECLCSIAFLFVSSSVTGFPCSIFLFLFLLDHAKWFFRSTPFNTHFFNFQHSTSFSLSYSTLIQFLPSTIVFHSTLYPTTFYFIYSYLIFVFIITQNYRL